MSKVVLAACGAVLLLSASVPRLEAAPDRERLGKAVQLTKQGKYGEAIGVYEAMLKAKPEDTEVLGRIGPLLFLTGEHERARQIFERATVKLPKYAMGFYFYAYALRKLGQSDSALDAYGSYRRLAPKDPLALYGMASCYQAVGRDGEALKAYRDFVIGATQSPLKARLEGWIQRARAEAEALEKKVAIARALAAVREALESARRAEQEGRPQEAEKILRAGLASLGAPPLLGSELGGLLIRARRFAEAVAVLKAALAKEPALSEARYRLALALRYSGDLSAATEAYRALLKEKPDHPDAHYGLAETLRKAGRLKEALPLYSRYVAIEKRPAEQVWVTKAREQIEAIQKQLAQPSPAGVVPGGPRPGSTGPAAGGGEASLEGITDPRIRAILEAKLRFQQRQGGREVPGPGSADVPDRKPLVTGGAGKADRDRDAKRRKEEAERKREEAKAKALEARRLREDAARRRKEEAERKREEAKAKALEARRQREEAARRRSEELARQREEAKARAAQARVEKDARSLLGGGRGTVTPAIGEVLVGWAAAATAKGDHARTLAIWKVLAAAKPGDTDALHKLAQAATAAGDHRAAADAYGALLMANPKDRSLYIKVRAAEAKAGMPLTPLPALAVTLPPEIVEGRSLLAKGQWAQALAAAQRRLKAASTDGLAMVLEAEALFAGRRFAEAKIAAERALKTNPKLAGPHRLLGGEHLRLRDRSAALAEYRLFLKKLAEDPSEERHRAYVTTMVERLSR